jgi:hypothetical protein
VLVSWHAFRESACGADYKTTDYRTTDHETPVLLSRRSLGRVVTWSRCLVVLLFRIVISPQIWQTWFQLRTNCAPVLRAFSGRRAYLARLDEIIS